MPFDIPLQKPATRGRESNRVWLDLVLHTVPELQEVVEDRGHFAALLAADIGLTPDEYVSRGIGLAAMREDPYCRVSFWEEHALIELSSFPAEGPAAAIQRCLPIIEALGAMGFELLHPSTHERVVGSVVDALLAAYEQRQGQVEAVAKLAGGTPV